MKAVVFRGIRNVEIVDVPSPQILAPDDVIVKMESAAICGSDMHVYHGRETGIDSGTIMGHEFSGTVVEVGGLIAKFKRGDRVLSPFTVNCGSCFYCTIGLTARCQKSQLYGWVENGEGLQGVHAEYIRVPMGDSTLVGLPEDLSWQEGNILADIASTGYFGAEQAEIKINDLCVVVGCGPVGIMAIKAAKLLGAKEIYAIDSVDFRLNFAEECGAIPINFLEVEVSEEIKKKSDSSGADCVIEAVGSKASMETSFELLRPGGILSTIGVQAFDELPFSPSDMYDKNITLKAGRCSSRYYAEKLIPMVQNGDFKISDVITHTFNLIDGKEAYRVFDEQKESCLKVLFKA